jgi:ABC-type transporter Mla MlaB component
VRDSGVLDVRAPLTTATHVCWVYDDPECFVDAAQRYLALGLARGQRLLCVGDGLADDLRAAGEPFGPLDPLVADGTLRFETVSDAYAVGDVLSPAGQWAFYDAAVHPHVHAPLDPPPFRIWFDGSRLVVEGSVDTFAADRLARVLETTPAPGGTTVLDLSRLEVADVACCRILAGWARSLDERGGELRIEGAPRSVLRIWGLLGLAGRAPVTFAEGPR